MFEKDFKDNVLGYIEVTEKIIWDLIRTREFQRLQRINQLGGTYVIFHTTEHSRFSHSIGVYGITKKMIDTINGINLTKKERIVVLCAALLHDIGHGPFSHAFEEIFNYHHENYTVKFILEDSQINSVLKKYDETLPKEIASIIQKTHPNKLLISLISSQFDADRLDYLIRDAYNTGVPYGNLDLQRLFKVMQVYDNRLVFKNTGLKEIENYVLSRYHMYYQIYFHGKTSSFRIMIKNILLRYKYLTENKFEFKNNYDLLKPFINQNITNNDYYLLDDYTMYHYIKLFTFEEDLLLSDLSKRLLNGNILKYKNYTIDDESLINKMKYIYEKNNIDIDYFFEITHLKKDAYNVINEPDEQLIYLIDENKNLIELSVASPIIKFISFDNKEIKKTVFFPEILSEEVNNIIINM
ncbi:MAG: HD domain-containing protein [Bacilli bacterium]